MGELIYQVYDLKLREWLPPASGGFDFSGNFGNPIGAIRLGIRNFDLYYNIIGFGTKEILTYKVHTKSTLFHRGRWSDSVTNDRIAGDCKHQIDMIMIKSNKHNLVIKTHDCIDNKWVDNLNDCDIYVSGVQNKPIDVIKVYHKKYN